MRRRCGTEKNRIRPWTFLARIRRWAALLRVLGALLTLAAPASAQSLRGNEDEIKAAFLVNFIKLVEWPTAAFSDRAAPLTLCVIGHDPIAVRLDQALKEKTVAGRATLVRRTRPQDELGRCHLLFFGAAQGEYLPAFLRTSRRAPVLTVGESKGFAQAGGVINFFLQDDGVRFEINTDAAERNGLRIHSRVLGLARIVRESSKGK